MHSSEASIGRKEFNDLEGRYIDLDYRFSELEKVLHLLLESVAEGHLPTPVRSLLVLYHHPGLTHPSYPGRD